MVRLNVAIAEDVKSKLQARATESGYDSLESYVEALLASEAQTADFLPPPHLHPRDRDHLSQLVQEGLQSPAREMTATDWDRLRRELAERHGGSGRG
jgi:hypothetical protein